MIEDTHLGLDDEGFIIGHGDDLEATGLTTGSLDAEKFLKCLSDDAGLDKFQLQHQGGECFPRFSCRFRAGHDDGADRI